jgi:branched-chain amino acid transport system ATP-binding protein
VSRVAESAPRLEVRHAGVSFGGVRALDDVDLTARTGEVTGLIGPNGAGKTTLFNVVSGLVSPDPGRVVLDGRDCTRWPPHRRARLGVARTFQQPQLFSRLTVAQNLMAAWEASRGWGGVGRQAARTGWSKVAETLDELGLEALADRPADSLTTATARLAELARTVVTSPRLLLLDEPGSGLDPEETVGLGRILRHLLEGRDLAVLLVEHDMSLVMSVCDRIVVLDTGRVIACGAPDAVRRDPAVIRAYLGTVDAA